MKKLIFIATVLFSFCSSAETVVDTCLKRAGFSSVADRQYSSSMLRNNLNEIYNWSTSGYATADSDTVYQTKTTYKVLFTDAADSQNRNQILDGYINCIETLLGAY